MKTEKQVVLVATVGLVLCAIAAAGVVTVVGWDAVVAIIWH